MSPAAAQRVAARQAPVARPSPPSGQRQDRPKFLPAEGRRRAPAAERPLQAESSPAAARRPCWDRPYAPASLRAAAVGPLSPRPVPAAEQAEAELAPALAQVQQRPLLRLAASNRAAARRPCWDRPPESAQQAAAPSWSLPALSVALVRAEQQAAPRRQRPSARSDPEAPSPAVARTPCSDRP